MNICWRRHTTSGYTSWQRISFTNSTILKVSLMNITAERKLLPKISSFSHPTLSVVSPDEEIWFQIETDGIPMRYLSLILINLVLSL